MAVPLATVRTISEGDLIVLQHARLTVAVLEAHEEKLLLQAENLALQLTITRAERAEKQRSLD